MGEIYRRHADVVYRRCLTMLGSRDAAKDAVQEIFVKVLSQRVNFRGDADPMTWIYRITTNHALNHLRSRRTEMPIERIDVALHPRCGESEASVISRDLLSQLLSDLDRRGQAILFLHFVDGLGQQQVADTLGISRRAVVKRLGRIRVMLAALGASEERRQPA